MYQDEVRDSGKMRCEQERLEHFPDKVQEKARDDHRGHFFMKPSHHTGTKRVRVTIHTMFTSVPDHDDDLLLTD